jgi:hypothetical protein
MGLVIVAVVALQLSVVDDLVIGGVHPEIVWLLPIFAGLTAGPEVGCGVGFAAGLLLDCMLPTPLGLTALVGCTLGFGTGLLFDRGVVVGDGHVWWLGPAIAAGGSALATAAYGLVGWLLGQDAFLDAPYLVLLPLVAIVAGLLAIPAMAVTAWALGEARPRRRRRLARVGW